MIAEAGSVSPEVRAKYEAVIGIECHVELTTASKMFCGCPNVFGGAPNTNVCPVCLALPGALPVPNAKAIELIVRAGLAFDAEIPTFAKFDRKNYFYPDMPKNYQISQYDTPLTQGGVVRYWLEDGTRGACRLTRIHLEEDTGKSTHASADGRLAGATSSLVDFNRAGVPLMECVGEPDLRSAEEAVAFLESLARTFRALGVSDVKMEEGSLRCDANVSVRLRGAAEYGTKAEIKNMNSFRSVRRAIESEIARQIGVIESGGRVIQETRGWDETAGVTHSLRSKEQAHDYRYFPDPDLVPLDESAGTIDAVRATLDETPYARYERYVDTYGIASKQATQLVDDARLSAYFDAVVELCGQPVATVNFVLGDLARLSNEAGTAIADGKVSPESLAELVNLASSNAISSTSAKRVLEVLWSTGGTAQSVVDQEGLALVNDSETLQGAISAVLDANPKVVSDYQLGKTNVLGFLTGQVVRYSKGKADAALVQSLIKDKLAVSFDRLREALNRPKISIRNSDSLVIAESPAVFVAPTFAPDVPSTNPLAAEVLFVKASAAVGKSTICRKLSHELQIPILDLSVQPVGAGSLLGILADQGSDAVDLFLNGELPVIVDALDEGRLLSHSGLDRFLEDSGRLLSANRRATNTPKLIFFGRPDAIELAAITFEIAAPDVRTMRLNVRLFDLDSAISLIKLYGDALHSPSWADNPKPVDAAIRAYFDAIAAALGLKPGELWNSDEGRAFAGYAPVLRAVGELLAEFEDFHKVRNDLISPERREAWSVIERVVGWILTREQTKLRNQLKQDVPNLSEADFASIYDAEEQVAFLYQYVNRFPLRGSGKLSGLPPQYSVKYLEMVENFIGDHPFVEQAQGQRKFANTVLASYVVARVVLSDFKVGRPTEDLLVELSQFPFLWRNCESKLLEATLLDGQYLGYILCSYWSDPAYGVNPKKKQNVQINGDDQEGMNVRISYGQHDPIAFQVAEPLILFEQIRDIAVDVRAEVRLVGRSGPSNQRTFNTHGSVSIVARRLVVEAEEMIGEGRFWLSATDVSASPRLLLRLEDANYGWGGAVQDVYPWSSAPSRISTPTDTDDAYLLVDSVARKASANVPIIVNADLSLPNDGGSVAWARRLGPRFAALLRLIENEKLARAERVDASGPAKLRFVFSFNWDDLLSAMRGSAPNDDMERLARRIREKL